MLQERARKPRSQIP